jgi:hypothetical protein
MEAPLLFAWLSSIVAVALYFGCIITEMKIAAATQATTQPATTAFRFHGTSASSRSDT